MNVKFITFDLVCGRYQEIHKVAFLYKDEYLTKKYLSFPLGLKDIFCCLNSSHFLEYYGECSYKIPFNKFDETSYDYETPDCPIHNNRKHSQFHMVAVPGTGGFADLAVDETKRAKDHTALHEWWVGSQQKHH